MQARLICFHIFHVFPPGKKSGFEKPLPSPDDVTIGKMSIWGIILLFPPHPLKFGIRKTPPQKLGLTEFRDFVRYKGYETYKNFSFNVKKYVGNTREYVEGSGTWKNSELSPYISFGT